MYLKLNGEMLTPARRRPWRRASRDLRREDAWLDRRTGGRAAQRRALAS